MQKVRHPRLLICQLLVSLCLVSCSSYDTSKNAAKEACDLVAATHKSDRSSGDFYARPEMQMTYRKTADAFRALSESQANKDPKWSRYFKVFEESINRFSSGTRWDQSGIIAVDYFCGPKYNISTRDYPELVVMKTTIEDFLGEKEFVSIQDKSEDSTLPSDFNWTPLIFLGLFLFYILCAYWIAKTAKKAGRSFVGWFLLGLSVPPIAGIIVLSFKPDGKHVNDLRKCPYCAELVKIEAKFCRFCSKEL